MPNLTPTARLAAMLKPHGLHATATSEPSYEEDGELRLDDRVHVQVPADGLPGVVRATRDGCLHFYPQRARLADLIADLKAALAEGRMSATTTDNMARRCICGARDWLDLAGQIQCLACGRRERRWGTQRPATRPQEGRHAAPHLSLTRWVKEQAR